MSAAVAEGAPAPVVEAAAPAPDAPEQANPVTDLNDLIGIVEPAAEAPADEQVTEPEKPAEPAAADAAPDPNALFTDAALATKEGITAARKHLRAEQTKWLDKHTENTRRGRKLSEQVATFKADKTTFGLAKQQFDADVGALMRGDGKTRLEALGRLTRQTPHAAYEDLSIAIMGIGKAPPKPDATTAALQKDIADLRAELAAEREQGKQQTQAQKQAEWIQAEVGKITTTLADPRFKLTAAWFEDDPQAVRDRVFDRCVQIGRDTGKQPSYEEVIAQEEQKLLARYNRTQAAPGSAPQGEGTRALPTNQPAQAQRPPGQTVTQAAATQQQTTRPETEAERLKRLAEAPDLMQALGFE